VPVCLPIIAPLSERVDGEQFLRDWGTKTLEKTTVHPRTVSVTDFLGSLDCLL